MFKRKQFLLLLLFTSLTVSQNIQTKLPTTRTFTTNSNRNIQSKKVVNTTSPTSNQGAETMRLLSEDTATDEVKDEISVNDLLENVKETVEDNEPEDQQGPHYELSWDFTDKHTIIVKFDLFYIPASLIDHNPNSVVSKRKSNLLATVTTMPSRSLKSIAALKYLRFIIRPYHKNKEIVLKLERLNLKNSTSTNHTHFSNVLRLTNLNHHEKYSICICYYRANNSLKTPDFFLCQDIINDYAKFGHLKADLKHGLVFITTQYSIIIALLIVLQSVFTMRKRRVAQQIAQMLTNKAHSFRTTLSSVSLGRQSFSSLDTAAERQQQQHATNSHANSRERIAEEEKGIKKRIISSPEIVITEQSAPANSEETEPFLKRIPSKNHVHFLLGPGEGSDDEDEHDHDDTDVHTQPTTLSQIEPYNDQSDALLSMAHILDTNKPWCRHGNQTSPA